MGGVGQQRGSKGTSASDLPEVWLFTHLTFWVHRSAEICTGQRLFCESPHLVGFVSRNIHSLGEKLSSCLLVRRIGYPPCCGLERRTHGASSIGFSECGCVTSTVPRPYELTPSEPTGSTSVIAVIGIP